MDTETTSERDAAGTLQHTLKFGYACYMQRRKGDEWTDEEWLKFGSIDTFWSFVLSHTRPKTKLYIFCHNTNFDLPVLHSFIRLPVLGYRILSAIIEGPPTILRYRTDTKCSVECCHPYHTRDCKERRRVARTIIIIDTLNIWRMPLKELGKEIGLEKYEMPDDNDLGLDWETYGRRDVEIIRDACIRWFRFLRQQDYGSFANTLAGQAMRVYRHKYMHHAIYIDDNESSLNLTREGYYGGRCEAFRIGRFKQLLSLLDINSMYPSVMASQHFPCRLLTHTRYPDIGLLTKWVTDKCVTALVTLNTDIPFAPRRLGSKLVFPVGEFRAILSTPELQYGLKHGAIKAVHECSIYESAPLFTDFVLDLYQKRLDAKAAGRPVEAFMFRKILNSFYGKWGQSGFKWEEVENTDDLTFKRWPVIHYESNTVVWYRQFGGVIQAKSTKAETNDSFPAIAAHVTAHARMVLYDVITLAGADNVFYCDTDSVLVNERGRENLESLCDPTKLGYLSVKGVYNDCEIFGAKDYVFGDKFRCKGVRNKAIWLNRNTVEQDCWSGLRGLLATGNFTSPCTARVIKRLSRVYSKALVLPDGRVTPWRYFGGEILNSPDRGKSLGADPSVP